MEATRLANMGAKDSQKVKAEPKASVVMEAEEGAGALLWVLGAAHLPTLLPQRLLDMAHKSIALIQTEANAHQLLLQYLLQIIDSVKDDLGAHMDPTLPIQSLSTASQHPLDGLTIYHMNPLDPSKMEKDCIYSECSLFNGKCASAACLSDGTTLAF